MSEKQNNSLSEAAKVDMLLKSFDAVMSLLQYYYEWSESHKKEISLMLLKLAKDGVYTSQLDKCVDLLAFTLHQFETGHFSNPVLQEKIELTKSPIRFES